MPEIASGTLQIVTGFRLTARRTKAAQLLAEDALTDDQIAEKVGVSRQSLARWKRQPAFAELVSEITERLAAEIRGKGLVELSKPRRRAQRALGRHAARDRTAGPCDVGCRARC
jgi:hypothetical protein